MAISSGAALAFDGRFTAKTLKPLPRATTA